MCARAESFGVLQIVERTAHVAERPVDVGDGVQNVRALDRVARDHRHGQRFLENREGALMLAHAAENVPEVRQIADDREIVLALPVDGERVFRNRQRVGVPSLVPAQQPDAAQRIALERRVAALPADAKRGGQRAIGGIEPFEQRRHVALTQIRLGEPR